MTEEFYNSTFKRVFEVRDIFNDFFGEERVDLHGIPSLESLKESADEVPYINSGELFILVYWDKVRITNENDRYIDIQDLYAKLLVNLDGSLRNTFRLNRTTYTDLQYRSNYMHSHISDISEDSQNFGSPCFGNGPIISTMACLNDSFDEMTWRLFCLELDKYVHVESLTGGPYHRLEQLGIDNNTFREIPKLYSSYGQSPDTYNPVWRSIEEALLKSLMENNILRIVAEDNALKIGMDDKSIIITISNFLISLYNSKQSPYDHIPRSSILTLFNSANVDQVTGKLMVSIGDSTYDDVNSRHPKVLEFKGEPKYLTIIKEEDSNNNDYLILRSPFIESIVSKVIYLINHYGSNKARIFGSKDISTRVDKEPVIIL